MSQKIKQDYYVGSNLRRLRNQTGLTQEQVCAKLQTEGIGMSRDFTHWNFPFQLLFQYIFSIRGKYEMVEKQRKIKDF